MLLLRWLSLFLLSLVANCAEYQLCFLEDGPNAGKLAAEQAKQLQAEHMQHINRMWKDGALESAGPTGGLAGMRGIFLFGTSAETAAHLGAADPKVAAGELKLRCSTWNGPNAVGRAYRDAYGKPGFKDQYVRRVAVLLPSKREVGKTIVAGDLTGGEFRYFALLDREDLAKVKEELPQATCFVWFHDAQVWNGVS